MRRVRKRVARFTLTIATTAVIRFFYCSALATAIVAAAAASRRPAVNARVVEVRVLFDRLLHRNFNETRRRVCNSKFALKCFYDQFEVCSFQH